MQALKILLVEDEDDARELYSYILTAAGYQVKAVRNGMEAFAELEENRPDVMVTDIEMPGVDGLDLIVAVRARSEIADLPVVAMTAFGDDLLRLAKKVGANVSIVKPTELERMREVIDNALNHHSR